MKPLLLLLVALMTPAIIPSAEYEIKPKEEIRIQLPEELRRACSCESSFEGTADALPRQFELDGSVRTHRNRNGSEDQGACMVNSVHSPTATRLGLDYRNSQADNYALALRIYKEQGIGAWYAYDPKTRDCVWNKQYK